MRKAILKIKLYRPQRLIDSLFEIHQEFSEPFWQHDRIFVPRGYSRDKSVPRISLRTIVRDPKTEAQYALVMRRHFSKTGLDVVNATEVKDYTEAAHILYQLGYELKAEVSRRRRELILGNSVRFFIDTVDGLPGNYAKIEADLREGEDIDDAIKDLIETFAALGFKKITPIKQTYGELIESSEHDTIVG